jgi:hypothetical protein
LQDPHALTERGSRNAELMYEFLLDRQRVARLQPVTVNVIMKLKRDGVVYG